MSTQIIMQREGTHLVPVNAAEAELLSEIPHGVDMHWTGVQPRSPQHHRFFFALLNIVWHAIPDEQQDRFGKSPERMRKWLTVQAGHALIEEVPPEALTPIAIEALRRMDDNIFFSVVPTGNVRIARAKSIAWHKLDQRKFKPLCDRVIDVIVTKLLPQMESKTLIGEVEAMIGLDYSDL